MSSSKTTWLALIALNETALPNANDVITALAGQGGATAELPISVSSQTDSMVSLDWGEASAAYTLVDRPIPASQLAGPCETAWYWPDAAQSVKDHTSHLFVTLVDEGRDAIQKSIRLTALVNAISKTSSACGILWGPAGLIHEPEAFAHQAAEMSDESLPLFLWIDFRIEAVEDGLIRFFSTGLEAFERKDLEMAPTSVEPQQLLDDVYNVAHYMIQNESAIKDADTIGLADGRQLVSSHEASFLDSDQQVIRIEYEN